jgi:hypothetical protein
MEANEIIKLDVSINENIVLSTYLTLKYAEQAVKYAFEAVKISRIEDEKKLLEYENAERISNAEAPIVTAINQFEEAISQLKGEEPV